MAVSKSLRHQVMRRDSHTCRYCGAQAPDVKLTIDHVTPVTLGGQDVPENLVTACADCNAGKSSSPPDASLVADVDDKAVRWRGAMEAVLTQRAAELSADRKRIAKFDRKWRSFRTYGEHYRRDVNWRNSIIRFLASGLDDQFLADAVETAVGRPRMAADDVWKYFCGICWRELDDLQKRATLVVEPAVLPEPLDPESDEAMLAEGFPFMEMFSLFLEEVMTTLHVPEPAALVIRRSLWDTMEATNKTWSANQFGSLEQHEEFLEEWTAKDDGWHGDPPSRYDLAVEFLSSYIGYDMYTAGLAIREAAGGTCPSPS